MEGIHKRIREARKFSRLTQSAVAKHFGIDRVNVTQWESGTTKPDRDKIPELARLLNSSIKWMMTGEGRGPTLRREFQDYEAEANTAAEPPEEKTVPLVGYVGAGGEHHKFAIAHDNLDRVPAPDGATPETVAVEIRGESLGALFDRWLVYYDDVRRPMTDDLLNKLCIVGLNDDRVLIKKVRRSKKGRGLFDLESATEPKIEAVTIAWAARVKSMTPRH